MKFRVGKLPTEGGINSQGKYWDKRGRRQPRFSDEVSRWRPCTGADLLPLWGKIDSETIHQPVEDARAAQKGRGEARGKGERWPWSSQWMIRRREGGGSDVTTE